MADESPNALDSKSMIGFVPSAQQPTLQSSKVQNCQNRGQLLRGSHSKIDLNFDNFELSMIVMLAVESADQI